MSASRKPWDVLVTGASTRVAYSLVRSLARDGLRVGVGTDEHSGMAACSRYCSGVFRHPSPERDPAGFIAAVGEALRTHRAAVCMPADEEAFVLAEYRDLLDATSSRTALAPVQTLLKLDDKHRATELAESLGIPVPATIRPLHWSAIAAFARTHQGPLVLKMIRSSGGRGVWILRPDELDAVVPRILERSGTRYGDFIVQEYVRATGYGVSMLFDRGELKARFVHRRLRERSPLGGPSTLRESVRHPVLEAHAERLLRHVGFHGVAMVEFKHDEISGRSWFLEANPRWWGSVALAIRAGVNFPVLCHRLALGEELPPPPDYATGIRVRWLLGDLLALKNDWTTSKRLPTGRQLWPTVDGYDDFHLDDPGPVAAQFLLRCLKGVRSRRSDSGESLADLRGRSWVPDVAPYSSGAEGQAR